MHIICMHNSALLMCACMHLSFPWLTMILDNLCVHNTNASDNDH